jgi:hypothetical protein
MVSYLRDWLIGAVGWLAAPAIVNDKIPRPKPAAKMILFIIFCFNDIKNNYSFANRK